METDHPFGAPAAYPAQRGVQESPKACVVVRVASVRVSGTVDQPIL